MKHVPLGQAKLPWDALIDDPVETIRADRESLGDTFVVESGDMRYLFVFSAEGVRAFYAIDEAVASKGIADMRMLARKVPADLFFDRRTIPHDMFTRDLAAAYLDQVDAALTTELELLGDEGEVEVFEFTRRLGHRFGLASWGGPGAAAGQTFDRLVSALDVLDASAAFVTPAAAAEIAENDHRNERAALAEIEAAYASIVKAHDASPQPGMFATIVDRWDGEDRVRGIARDVALVHIGSMSNLFAAVGWAIVHLVARPDLVARVRAGELDLAERCALESIRIAQRSIMLREVLQATTISIDGTEYELAVGDTLATLLPLTNSEAPGFSDFDPDRWKGRRLADVTTLAARELVTGFGHGSHTCPAQPFSLRVMVDTLTALVGKYDLSLSDSDPRPLVGQIGGVARSDGPCELRYHLAR